jgi:hypothetical protein
MYLLFELNQKRLIIGAGDYFRLWLTRCTFPSTLSHKGRVLGNKGIKRKMYISSFSINFVRNIFILRRTGRDVVKNVYWSSCKVTVILV